MAFDSVLTILGMVLIAFGLYIFLVGKQRREDAPSNKLEGFGISIDVANPSVLLIVLGVGLVLVPRFFPHPEPDAERVSTSPPGIATSQPGPVPGKQATRPVVEGGPGTDLPAITETPPAQIEMPRPGAAPAIPAPPGPALPGPPAVATPLPAAGPGPAPQAKAPSPQENIVEKTVVAGKTKAAPKAPVRVAPPAVAPRPPARPAPVTQAARPAERVKPQKPRPASPPPAPPGPGLWVLVDADVAARAGMTGMTAQAYSRALAERLVRLASERFGEAYVTAGGAQVKLEGSDYLQACRHSPAGRVLLATVRVPQDLLFIKMNENDFWPDLVLAAVDCEDGRVKKMRPERLLPRNSDAVFFEQDFLEHAERFINHWAHFLQ